MKNEDMVSQDSAGKDLPWSACWNFIFLQSHMYLHIHPYAQVRKLVAICFHMHIYTPTHTHTHLEIVFLSITLWVSGDSWIFGHPVVIRCCDPQGHSDSVGLVVQHWLGEPLSHVLLRCNLDACQVNGSFIWSCVEIPKDELIWKQSLRHFCSSLCTDQLFSSLSPGLVGSLMNPTLREDTS